MLARMEPLTLDTMRAVAKLRGFAWTDAELEAIRSAVDASLRLLAALEALPLASLDPTIQYRIL
jgi:hypothetical protein